MKTPAIPAKRKGGLALAAALAITMILACGASPTFAADNRGGGFSGAAGGGYAGPGPDVLTVEKVKTLHDDARVALRGHIVQSLGGKEYLFKDNTGTINVEISPSRWHGQTVGPNDLVEIHGEVDKDWTTIEIDVKRIIKL